MDEVSGSNGMPEKWYEEVDVNMRYTIAPLLMLPPRSDHCFR
jgi:hypothetical protein